ncbi:DUF2163 domain-containing protein [Amaricoccus solimangrovi]|uniref:DUF2163 domain-containing protein n=1 Tax=Amaricoccus solimangrovi TaxID=2589815 RepID=A0A501WN22_9RHOB|nr:DUF2163 domain-containing protein [Amaricoccus solimangrovi]TPE50718.1 DUF2163 domain-containing protein [Amaricoccus solimangrovi]
MRILDAALRAHLEGGATSLCRCWLARRADGRAFGFTDHDDDLSFEGQMFRAGSGMDASALKSATGLSVDNLSVIGALTDAGVTEADIGAGRFDGAEVLHWLVNWRAPEQRILVFRGTFGEISRKDGGFEVELRGPAEALNLPVGRNLLRRCDATLGDTRCGVDVSDAAHSAVARVRNAKGARVSLAELGHFEAAWFTGGRVVWRSGANVGLEGRVKVDAVEAGGRLLVLWQEPAFTPEPGDEAVVIAGCDGLAATCRAKFGNFLNFRGFPHIPGEDWVTAYPREGEVHDGGSRSR